jgi:hypothetical protein
MMAEPAQQNRYYPSKQKTGDLHDDFRLLFDHVYKLQDRMAAMTKAQGAAAPAGEDQGGPSTTKIAGLYVKGVVPQNGQKLTYNATTGQIEWQ